MTETLRIGLASWIIQDGNYGDFAVGRQYAFALEFCPSTPLTVRHPDAASGPISMTWLRDSTYAIKGKVTYVGEGWWVLGAGLPMYQSGSAPGPIGTPVAGEIRLGVDPFFYFENFAGQTRAPALIFDWRVEAIEKDAAPLVEIGPNSFARDRSRQSWTPLRHTTAWRDDNGQAAYALTCSRISDEPRREL